MEVAETIVQLVAHLGVLEAEVQRIDDDSRRLRVIANRYLCDGDPRGGASPGDRRHSTGGSIAIFSSATPRNAQQSSHHASRHSTLVASPSSSNPARGGYGTLPGIHKAMCDLSQLSKAKMAQITEIEQQLALFRLHHAAAQQLAAKLSLAQSVVVPPILGSSLSVVSDSSILATGSAGTG